MIPSGGYVRNRDGGWDRVYRDGDVGGSGWPEPWPDPIYRFLQIDPVPPFTNRSPPPEIPEIHMTMRAKFTVTMLTIGVGFAQLKMQPVGGKTGPDGKYVFEAENTKFWKASPAGDFAITVNSDAPAFPLVTAMKVGDEFYLDFTPAIVVDQPSPA